MGKCASLAGVLMGAGLLTACATGGSDAGPPATIARATFAPMVTPGVTETPLATATAALSTPVPATPTLVPTAPLPTASPVAATATPAPPVTRTPGAGKIVFEVAGEQSEIYLINPDGTGRTKVADGRSPVFSPDGRRIAYLTVVRGPTTTDPFGKVGVHTAGIDGSGASISCQTDANAQITLVRWSADGQTVALNAGQGFPGDIYLCKLGAPDLGPALKTAQGPAALIYDWAPGAGTALWQAGPGYADENLFVGPASGDMQAAHALTAGEHRITDVGPPHYAAARFAPDGRTIAVAGDRLFFASAPGGTSPLAGKVLTGIRQPSTVAWAPDGQSLAVIDGADHSLNVLDITTGGLRRLVEQVQAVDWGTP